MVHPTVITMSAHSASEYCLQCVYLYKNREQDEASTKKNYTMRNPFRNSLMASGSLACIKREKDFKNLINFETFFFCKEAMYISCYYPPFSIMGNNKNYKSIALRV